jgi:hypothetical protein
MAEKRKLAAILAADVVGFSRLTAVDDRCAQIPIIRRRLGERVRSTPSCRSSHAIERRESTRSARSAMAATSDMVI